MGKLRLFFSEKQQCFHSINDGSLETNQEMFSQGWYYVATMTDEQESDFFSENHEFLEIALAIKANLSIQNIMCLYQRFLND